MSREFSNARYRVVRDRQMKEMEEEDNFQNKVSIQYVLSRHILVDTDA